MSEPPSSESKPYSDETADLVLVSNEEGRFRVHSYQLMAHSVVFRDMLANPKMSVKSPRSQMDDIALDLSTRDLEIFLDLMHKGSNTGCTDWETWERVAEFAMQYDCPVVLRCLGIEAGRNVVGSVVWDAFCLAGRMDHLDLARTAIACMGSIRPLGSKNSWARLPLADLSIDMWRKCPEKLLLTLVRLVTQAERTRGVYCQDDFPWRQLAENFQHELSQVSSGPC